jgi:hypothetical protein
MEQKMLEDEEINGNNERNQIKELHMAMNI